MSCTKKGLRPSIGSLEVGVSKSGSLAKTIQVLAECHTCFRYIYILFTIRQRQKENKKKHASPRDSKIKLEEIAGPIRLRSLRSMPQTQKLS